jgi:hypothetical protein
MKEGYDWIICIWVGAYGAGYLNPSCFVWKELVLKFGLLRGVGDLRLPCNVEA